MNNTRQSGSGKTSPQPAGGEEKPSVFHNATPGERPPTDAGYLELLSFTLFSSAIGDRGTITDKWPDILFGFKNFHVQRVAEFSEEDLQEVSQRVPLLGDKPQVKAVVANAAAMAQISRVYGSFRKYLRSFEKDGPSELLKDMMERFLMLEGDIGEQFLVAVGERKQVAEPVPATAPQRPPHRRGQTPHQRQQKNGGTQTEAGRPQQGRADGQRQSRSQQGSGAKDNAQARNRQGRRRRFNWRRKKPTGPGAPAEAAPVSKAP